VPRQGTKDGDELYATAVLAAALGAVVTPHDDGSRQSMFDLVITYPGGRKACAEVVSTRNRQTMAQAHAVNKLGYTKHQDLTRMWMVRFVEGARLKVILPDLPGLLAQFEQDRIDNVGYGDDEAVVAQLRALQLSSVWSYEPTEKHPPGFYLYPAATGAWVGDGDSIVRECDAFLTATPDVASKLALSGMTERHAVVLVTVDWLGPLSAIESGAMPKIAPILPDGVDCLWLVALEGSSNRAIYWMEGTWREFLLSAANLDAVGLRRSAQ
jgi:hypothetical protein